MFARHLLAILDYDILESNEHSKSALIYGLKTEWEVELDLSIEKRKTFQ